MSSSSTLRLPKSKSLQTPPTSSSTNSSSASSSSLVLSSSVLSSTSASSTFSSRRTHVHSRSHSRPPQVPDARERKAHAKKLLKKFPVISPQSFGRVSKFCPICLDFLTSATITKTACNHLVHRSCLLKRLAEDSSATCPSCRVPIKAPRGSKSGGGGSAKPGKTTALQVEGAGAGVGVPLAGLSPIETFQ